ncbi:MAG: type II toxin-antitoxin system RelE/ParE family toxin [Pseudobutyrivibrio sp.]|nr:type II toxin-antitoxin system RelE/ParE family toxin [Pseudobutyrivibrio sp.]
MEWLVKIIYANAKIKSRCKDIKEATKFFGGNRLLALSLLSRINAIEQAKVINDIRVQKQFRFHNLKGKFDGYFAIDVKSIRDKWRIILQPLDEEFMPFNPCHIDEIAMKVQVVEVKEISAHYE